MPFRSKAQRRWMYRERPDIAERWERETPNIDQLPERIKPRYAKVYENSSFTNGLPYADLFPLPSDTPHSLE